MKTKKIVYLLESITSSFSNPTTSFLYRSILTVGNSDTKDTRAQTTIIDYNYILKKVILLLYNFVVVV